MRKSTAKIAQVNEGYQLNPPTIYESQLFPDGLICDYDKSYIDFRESMMVCFSGPRGAGKTLSLSLAAMKALSGGLKVWLNFPLEFNLIRDLTGDKKRSEHLKADLLNLKEFLSMKTRNITGGLIGLDEYQDIASAYTFNSTKNRLLSATWAQIRKLDLSFYYTSKFHKWVDTRTRDELDAEISCMDASRTPWGRKKYKRGEMIFWQLADWSGIVTGYQFESYPILRPYKFFGKPIWGAFPTRFRIDIFESMRGMKLDLEKDVISDKFETEDLNYEKIIFATAELFKQSPRWRPVDLWEELGVFVSKEKATIRRMLRHSLGMEEKVSHGQPWYVIGAKLSGEDEGREG